MYRKLFKLNFEIGSQFLKSSVNILFSEGRLQNPHEQCFSFSCYGQFLHAPVR